MHTELAKGSIFLFAGQFFGSFTRFFTNIVLTHLLRGAAAYGLFTFGLTIFRLVGELSLCGFQYGSQHFLPKYRVAGDGGLVKGYAIFSFICTLAASLLMGMVLFVFADFIAQVFNKPGLTIVLKVLSFTAPFYVCMMLSAFFGIAFLRVDLNVKIMDIIQPSLFLLFAAVLFVVYKNSLTAVLAVYSMSILLTVAAAFFFIRRLFGRVTRGCPPRYEKKKWTAYSGTVVFAGFFSMFLFQTDKIILGYFGNAEDMGVYNAAWKMYSFLGLSTVVFNTTFQPIISQLHSAGNMEELQSLARRVSKWIFSVNVFLIAAILFYSHQLMGIFGPEYVRGYPILIIFAVMWIPVSMLASVAPVLRMTGKQKTELLLSILTLSVSAAAGIMLIKRYGMVGAAITSVLCFGLIHISKAIFVYVYLGIKPVGKETVVSLFLATISAAASLPVLYLVRHTTLHELLGSILHFAVFAGLYVLLMLKYCLSEKDKIFIHIIKKKFTNE